MAQSLPTAAKPGQHRFEFGRSQPILVDVGQGSPQIGRSRPKVGHWRPQIGQSRLKFANKWSKSDQHRPDSVERSQIWPGWADLGPSSSSGRPRTRFGTKLPPFGRSWPELDPRRLNLGQFGPEVGRTPAQFWKSTARSTRQFPGSALSGPSSHLQRAGTVPFRSLKRAVSQKRCFWGPPRGHVLGKLPWFEPSTQKSAFIAPSQRHSPRKVPCSQFPGKVPEGCPLRPLNT